MGGWLKRKRKKRMVEREVGDKRQTHIERKPINRRKTKREKRKGHG